MILTLIALLCCVPTSLPVETCDVLEFNTRVYESGGYSEQCLKWTGEKDRATGEVLWACSWCRVCREGVLEREGEWWVCRTDKGVIRARDVIWTRTDFDPWVLRDFR